MIVKPPKILDQEIEWNKTETIVSKTNTAGTILYVNDTFCKTSEYSKLELINEPHNVIRHPDMPKVVFKVLWKNLKKGKNFHAIVKNLTKSGKYYWVITDFTIDFNSRNDISGYTARRKAVPESVVEKITLLYKTLLEIEKLKGEEASELYFNAYLEEEIGKGYNDFVLTLFQEELKKQQSKEKSAKFQKSLNWFFSSKYE